jgi:hypothetical protein
MFKVEMSYPEFAHLGFKVICTGFMVSSFAYMDSTIRQHNAAIQQRQQLIEAVKNLNTTVTVTETLTKAP